MSSLRWVSHQPQMQQVPRDAAKFAVLSEMAVHRLANEAHFEIERMYLRAKKRAEFIAAGIRPEEFPELFVSCVVMAEAAQFAEQVAMSLEALKKALYKLQD